MTNREKAEAAWGVPLPDWIEKLATALRRQGAAEDCGGPFRLPSHCEPRHSARPRKARLHPEPRRAPSRDFHHPLPRARAYQPKGVPG